METIDVIRKLCAQKGISISQLENELGYGNGSIAKAKNMSADRIYQIAQFFGVSMEYLMTGKTMNEIDDEIAIARQQQSILLEINKISEAMSGYYKRIDEYRDKLSELKREYIKLEPKTEQKSAPQPPEQAPTSESVFKESFEAWLNSPDLPFK